MPIHREKEVGAKIPPRNSRRETSTSRNTKHKESAGERPIITQDKPKKSSAIKPSLSETRKVSKVNEIKQDIEKKRIDRRDTSKSSEKRRSEAKKGSGDARTSSRKNIISMKDVLEKKISCRVATISKSEVQDDATKARSSKTVGKGDGDKRKSETHRNRTRTRTLSPTEVKQLVSARISKDTPCKNEETRIRTESVEKARYKGTSPELNDPVESDNVEDESEGEEEFEQDYEDDFEDYESDFEEDSESSKTEIERSKTEKPMTMPKSDCQRKEIEEINLALKIENEQTQTLTSKSTPDTPGVIQKEKDEKLQKLRLRKELQVSQKIRSRGHDLLSMISLDIISYSFLDIPSVPYEIYMKIYGKSNTNQAHTQTNEENLDEEVQTDVIDTCNKWVQKPPEVGQTKKYRLSKEERLGVGSDDPEKPYSPTINTVDIVKLNSFLAWSSQIVVSALDSKTGNSLRVNKVPNQSEEMHFSDGFALLNATDLPFLKDKSVTDICCLVNDLLSVHTNSTVQFGPSIICVWSIYDFSKPMKVLTASNCVTSVCFGMQRNLVFAGISDGTVCVWDLKESSAFHQSRENECEWTIRSPTYTTAWTVNSHSSPVISVRVIQQSNEEEYTDFTPVQVCSLEQNGIIIVWSVVQGRNLQNYNSDEDIGLAHWGKVKLVKSSAFSVTTDVGKELSATYVRCNDLALEQSEDVEIYVTNSVGSVYHISKYGTLMKPRSFGTTNEISLVETMSIEMCPFNHNYFLVGCKDGSIRLHCKNQELPLISLNTTLVEEGLQASIISLAWLYVRPFVFFALDSLSRIHIWDLGISDMYPKATLRLTEKKITCMRLMQSDNPKEKPHFVMATADGKIEIHRLKNEYSTRSPAERMKDTKKFLKYVNIL